MKTQKKETLKSVSRKETLKKFLVNSLVSLVRSQLLHFVLYLLGFKDIKELIDFLKELFF